MLNKRQENIIIILQEASDWVMGKKLAEMAGVSDRTIRSDIDAIHRFYHAPLIESNPRYGYKINHEVYHSLHQGEASEIPQTPKERCMYIIQKLLFEKNEINLTLLQEQVFISGYSIENDMKRIKKMLEDYPSLQLVRSKNYFSLMGDEKTKRKLFKDLLAEETKGNFLNLNSIASLYKDFDLIQVTDILKETFEEHSFAMREVALPMLILHVAISVERIIHHNYIMSEHKDDHIKELMEYRLAKSFYEKLSKKINIEIVEDEIVRLAFLLLGKRGSVYSNAVEIDHQPLNMYELADGLLACIDDTFDVDLSGDRELIVGLEMHLHSMIERQKQQVIIDNMFLPEIKRRYPLVFEMGVRVGSYLEEKLHFSISESEIGFISLHLGAAYDRTFTQKRYRAVLILPYDGQIYENCVNKIKSKFEERMEIIEAMTLFEESKVKALCPDLLLTTIPFTHSLNIVMLQISIFLNQEDENLITQELNRLDRIRSQIEFVDQIKDFLNPKYFYSHLDLKTPEEIISYMCDQLCADHMVSESYKSSVLEREKMSATSFVYSIATPHSLNVGSNVSTISVASLKKPVVWGEYQVKMVLLLALNQHDNRVLRSFFDWMAHAITDTNRFSAMLKSKQYEEFLHYFLDQQT